MLARFALVLALALALPGCPVPGSLRGIGTGNKPASSQAAPVPDPDRARYVYACVDADRPDAPVLRGPANDRAQAIELCLTELRRVHGGDAVSCRCRLEGNAPRAPGGA